MRRIVLIGLVGAATLTMQQWIGDVTIYLPVNRAKAERLHQSIIDNHPPAGLTWDSVSNESTNSAMMRKMRQGSSLMNAVDWLFITAG